MPVGRTSSGDDVGNDTHLFRRPWVVTSHGAVDVGEVDGCVGLPLVLVVFPLQSLAVRLAFLQATVPAVTLRASSIGHGGSIQDEGPNFQADRTIPSERRTIVEFIHEVLHVIFRLGLPLALVEPDNENVHFRKRESGAFPLIAGNIILLRHGMK